MKMIDITRRAGRSLKQAKTRTALTSLAISVGAFTIILSLALGTGVRAFINNVVTSNINERAIMIAPKVDPDNNPKKPKKYSEESNVKYFGNMAVKYLKQEDINKVSKVKGVESVTPYYQVSPKYITREGQDKYLLDVAVNNGIFKLSFAAGGDSGISRHDAILANEYLSALGFKNANDALGKTVSLAVSNTAGNNVEKLFDYKIVGVSKESDLSAMSTGATGGIYLLVDDMKELYDYSYEGASDYGTYFELDILVKDGYNVDDVKQKIIDAGYDATTIQDMMSLIFQFINVLQGILIGFGALAILTSVFGIINTQYISVLERTQQIGLMKALGMRRRDVGRLFKLEAAWIGFFGGSIGAGLAILAGTVANPYVSEFLKIGNNDLIIFEPWSVVAVVLGLIIVSVLSGILPARKAAKLDPIVALRTE